MSSAAHFMVLHQVHLHPIWKPQLRTSSPSVAMPRAPARQLLLPGTPCALAQAVCLPAVAVSWAGVGMSSQAPKRVPAARHSVSPAVSFDVCGEVAPCSWACASKTHPAWRRARLTCTGVGAGSGPAGRSSAAGCVVSTGVPAALSSLMMGQLLAAHAACVQLTLSSQICTQQTSVGTCMLAAHCGPVQSRDACCMRARSSPWRTAGWPASLLRRAADHRPVFCLLLEHEVLTWQACEVCVATVDSLAHATATRCAWPCSTWFIKR